MPLVLKLTSPTGEAYYGSTADSEGLRYRVRSISDAENFADREAAEKAISDFKAIREMKDYSYAVVEA